MRSITHQKKDHQDIKLAVALGKIIKEQFLNLLQIPNSESNSQYLKLCKKVKTKGHPARFPSKLPEFFIKFLTEKNDVVLDIFAGSNTTGAVAENLGRNWISFEEERIYLAASAFRFLDDGSLAKAQSIFDQLITPDIFSFQLPQKIQPVLLEKRAEYEAK